MALANLISVTFTQQELNDLDTAFTTIEQILTGKVINLTPEERQQYGRIRLENSQLPVKAKQYMTQLPAVVPSYIDTAEFNADDTARLTLEQRIARMTSIVESLDDTYVLLGTDVYTTCVMFYRALKSAAEANVPGATSAYQDMRQQFPGGSTGGNNAENGGDTPPTP